MGQQIPEFRDGFDVGGEESKGREGLADLDIRSEEHTSELQSH